MSTLWEKDTIQSEWKKIKHLPFLQKLGYIWNYYKWHICIIVAVISFLGVGIKGFIENQKDTLIRGAMINKFELLVTNGNYFSDTYPTFREMDEKKQTVELQVTLVMDIVNYQKETLQAYQNLMSQILVHELDFIASDRETLETYNKTTDVFKDLRQCLPTDLYEKLEEEGRIIWIPRYSTEENVNEYIASEEKYPLLIDVSNTHITDGMKMRDKELLISFVVNSENVDEYPYLLEYLLEYEPSVEETTQ